jgi:hypothetical protein
MKSHPLPKTKFSDRERAAWDWLHARNVRGWLVDLVNKSVMDWRGGKWATLIDFALMHGWDG